MDEKMVLHSGTLSFGTYTYQPKLVIFNALGGAGSKDLGSLSLKATPTPSCQDSGPGLRFAPLRSTPHRDFLEFLADRKPALVSPLGREMDAVRYLLSLANIWGISGRLKVRSDAVADSRLVPLPCLPLAHTFSRSFLAHTGLRRDAT